LHSHWLAENHPKENIMDCSVHRRRVGRVTLFTAALIALACGGPAIPMSSTVHDPALVAITVLPANQMLAAGLKLRFSARGTYSNGSAADVSDQVRWAAGVEAIVAIANGGVATTVVEGTSSIVASLGSISGRTTLTVMPVGWVNVTSYGAVCDGVADDTAALAAMMTALGNTPTTIILQGSCYVTANYVFPAIQPIFMERGSGFSGPGVVTYTPWGQIGPVAPTVHRLTGARLIDYGHGTYTLRGSAAGASITNDEARGAQALSWTTARPNQFTEIVTDGMWDLSRVTSFTIDLGFAEAAVDTSVMAFISSDVTYTSFANFAVANVGGKNHLLDGFAHLPRTSVTFTKAAMNQIGSPNFAAVKHIGIRLVRNGTTNAVPTAYIYGLWTNVTARPKVLVTVDDGFATLFTKIYPVMKAANLRGTAYVNGAHVDLAGWSTASQLGEMYAAGWDIGNHGWDHASPGLSKQVTVGSYRRVGSVATITFGFNHGYAVGSAVNVAGCDAAEYNGIFAVATVPNPKTITFAVPITEPSLTAAGDCYIAQDPTTVSSEIRRNRDYIVKNGWPRAADHVAYPYGSWDLSILPLLQNELGVKTGRLVGASNTNLYNISTFNGLGAQYMLPGYDGNPAATAVLMLAEVDAAIDANATVIFFTHGLDDSAPSSSQMLTSEFQSFIEGLVARRAAGLIDVVTISEWFDRL
jgi:Polysaccharide deacetylase